MAPAKNSPRALTRRVATTNRGLLLGSPVSTGTRLSRVSPVESSERNTGSSVASTRQHVAHHSGAVNWQPFAMLNATDTARPTAPAVVCTIDLGDLRQSDRYTASDRFDECGQLLLDGAAVGVADRHFARAAQGVPLNALAAVANLTWLMPKHEASHHLTARGSLGLRRSCSR